MVNDCDFFCPKCGGQLKHYDRVRRIVRTTGGLITWTKIRRMICSTCGAIHREIPNYIFPYKHYESRIIRGVILGDISPCDLDYEDYPCEATMIRWIRSLGSSFSDE